MNTGHIIICFNVMVYIFTGYLKTQLFHSEGSQEENDFSEKKFPKIDGARA